jgi:hypothetical protein
MQAHSDSTVRFTLSIDMSVLQLRNEGYGNRRLDLHRMRSIDE